MKKISIILFAFFTWAISFSQVDVNQLFLNSPELIIKFQIQERSELEILTHIVSIDKVKGNEVTAYTNQKEFEQFLTLNIPYEIVEKPVLTSEELNMKEFDEINAKNRTEWNFYPTYEGYLSLMEEFAINYPDICKLVEFGTSVQNRKLLACVISKNVNEREAEPQVLWTSSMHGDETAGYVLMLHYIDYLLTNYGTDERITYMLDNMEIWINPLANPDGTYWGGNSTVNGSRRNNANNVDLNRNYKDWVYGDHPDNKAWQNETLAFMNLQDEETFVLGANLHGGTAVCNYPWDNTYTYHADDAWWYYVCREYADTVHAYSSNYMTDYDNGITRGCDWYVISGGRQDYSNYYKHHREFTLELSYSYVLPATQLINHWNYNYRSFLNYTQQALYGIHGTVTDACSGEPLYAEILINGHDVNESYVMTDPRVGYYARLIKGGTYSVTYSADGYISQTKSITVSDKQQVIQNIKLVTSSGIIIPTANFEADITELFINETVHFEDMSENATAWEWVFEGGTPETSNEQNPIVLYETSGKFDVKLTVSNEDCSDVKIIEDYIYVMEYEPVANFEADTTEIFENETVHFTNLSENATFFIWFFEGGTPETSTEQNPTVLYENKGSFSVTLIAFNQFGDDEITKEKYITVNEKINICEIDVSKFNIFPNPVKTNSTITIESEIDIMKVEFVNLLGEVVKTVYPKTKPYNISISGIENGMYVIKMETEKSNYISKIVIY